jgi:hypothetical protein
MSLIFLVLAAILAFFAKRTLRSSPVSLSNQKGEPS